LKNQEWLPLNEENINAILREVFSSLEPLETQSSAVLQFLKAKGLATDEDLAPFLEQASNAASVRWRATRVRTEALVANLMKREEEFIESAAKENANSDERNEVREKNSEGSSTRPEVSAQSDQGSTAAKPKDAVNENDRGTKKDLESAA
jgi:hypothetical protein